MSKFASPFIAFRFRDFRLLYIGVLVSRIGAEMQLVGINWHTYILTGSAFSLGLIGLARFLPVIAFSLLGGLIADNFDRRKVMIFAQSVTIITSIVLTFITYKNWETAYCLYVIIALISTATTFDTPARQSIVPCLVPPKFLTNAISMTTVIWQTACVLGPTLAGFTIAYMGIKNVYLINSICFAIGLLCLFFMHSHKNEDKKINNTFHIKQIVEGLSFVKRTPMIYSTMFLDFFATFFSSATVLLPIYAKDILKVGPSGMGILYAAPSFGAIIAGLFVSSLKHVKHQGRTLLLSVAMYGLATALFAFSKSFYLSFLFLFFAGIGDVVSTIIRNTIRQVNTPDYLRGRMVSVNMIFFMGGPMLGEMEAGILAALIGAPLSVFAGGIGTIAAVGALAFFIPKLRKYRGDEVIL